MGMTIKDAGNIIDRYDINFYDDNGHKIDPGLLAQAFDTALATMRKYQKIEDLVNDCADESVDDTSCCARYIGLIEEIIYTEEQEDGNKIQDKINALKEQNNEANS